MISEALFASLVIMALVTTLMAGPLLRLLDPRNEYGAPLGEELDRAKRESEAERPSLAIPDRSILLAPRSERASLSCCAIGEPLARPTPQGADSGPPGESTSRGGRRGSRRVGVREPPARQGHGGGPDGPRPAPRTAGWRLEPSPSSQSEPGGDLSHVASRAGVDLALTEGRRPLLGEGVPRGAIVTLLGDAPCDVGVLVAARRQAVAACPRSRRSWFRSEGRSTTGPRSSSGHGSRPPPRRRSPVGAASGDDDTARLSRMLADAALLVQSYANVPAEPLVSRPGAAIVEAVAGAALLVVGLSPRWREEGLGPVRSEIARTASAPVLFARRGTRPGALAPEENVTRFTWSTPGMSVTAS